MRRKDLQPSLDCYTILHIKRNPLEKDRNKPIKLLNSEFCSGTTFGKAFKMYFCPKILILKIKEHHIVTGKEKNVNN